MSRRRVVRIGRRGSLLPPPMSARSPGAGPLKQIFKNPNVRLGFRVFLWTWVYIEAVGASTGLGGQWDRAVRIEEGS